MMKVYFTNGDIVTYNRATSVAYYNDWMELLKEEGKYMVAVLSARLVLRVDSDEPCRVERPRRKRK